MRLPLSISLVGFSGPGVLAPGGVREQIGACAAAGYRAVQIDGAASGTRARELDRSARRDLAALLRRLGLGFSGIDLWIPPAHFTDGARVERATSAVERATTLAAELASLVGPSGPDGPSGRVVSIALPPDCPGQVAAHLAAIGGLHGVAIADHAFPPRPGVEGASRGIDPAAMIFAGADPVAEVVRLREPPGAARLTDLSAAGRVEPGGAEGKLDRAAYEAALVTRGYTGYLVADLRGLSDPTGAARRILEA